MLENPTTAKSAGRLVARLRATCVCILSDVLRRWESLTTAVQAAIMFPLLAVVFFAINIGLFNQPAWRSVLYGLIESIPFTAIVLIATANERRKRGRS